MREGGGVVVQPHKDLGPPHPRHRVTCRVVSCICRVLRGVSCRVSCAVSVQPTTRGLVWRGRGEGGEWAGVRMEGSLKK